MLDRVRRHAPLLLLTLLACGPGPQVRDPRGVLLVTVERLRADRMAERGGSPELLAPLATLGGTALTNLWSEDTDTRLAHAALLMGSPARLARQGSPRGGAGSAVRAGLPLEGSPDAPRISPSMPEAFLARGWATAAFLGSSSLDSLKGIERGFHDLVPAGGPASERDALTIARFGAWLDALPPDQDWFAWVHLTGLEELPLRGGPTVEAVDASAGGAEPAATAPDATALPGALDLRSFHGLPAPVVGGSALSAADLRARYDGAVSALGRTAGLCVQRARRASVGPIVAAVVGATGLSLGEQGAYLRRSGLAPEDFAVAGRLFADGDTLPERYDGLMALGDLAPTLLDLAGVGGEARRPMRSPSHAAALQRDVTPPRTAPADREDLHPAWSGPDYALFPALPVLLSSQTHGVLGFVDGELFWSEGLFRAGEAEGLLGYRPDLPTAGDPPRMALESARLLDGSRTWIGEDRLPPGLRRRVDALGSRSPLDGLWATLARIPSAESGRSSGGPTR